MLDGDDDESDYSATKTHAKKSELKAWEIGEIFQTH